MAEVTFDLLDGLTIGADIHTTVTLKEMSAGDILDAGMAAERPMRLADGSLALMQSSTLLGLEGLRRQVARVGDRPGALTLTEIRSLSGRDLSLLQAHAAELDEAAGRALAEALSRRGEP
ncbi:phage tail assembly protein [Roseospira navarrensis]|uniref:Mu-like prophage FluMu protein gp41 n=1 Tax=Roseospira navarrensis TaxID=140058 RepID=A0A7X2D3J0_9PROT|nr:phage tail assembly protein [Roseospira navarrensis]MQX36816.1 hypothetical protein [Roseospira navarrensis]